MWHNVGIPPAICIFFLRAKVWRFDTQILIDSSLPFFPTVSRFTPFHNPFSANFTIVIIYVLPCFTILMDMRELLAMSWLPGVCLQCYACDVLPRLVATSLRTRLTPKHLEIDPWTSEGAEGVADVADVAVDSVGHSVDFQTLKRYLG